MATNNNNNDMNDSQSSSPPSSPFSTDMTDAGDPNDHSFTRLYDPEQGPYLLKGHTGIEYKKRISGEYKLINILHFTQPNTDFYRAESPGQPKCFVINYFPFSEKPRRATNNVQEIFETPEKARLFLENTLRIYMEDKKVKLPTLEDFKNGECFLFPGCNEESGYVALNYTDPANNRKQILLHHLAVYAYLGHWLYEQDNETGPKIGSYAARAMDLSHRCHHKACFNPYHFHFEPNTANVHRCRRGFVQCKCGVNPKCILQGEVVKYPRVKRASFKGAYAGYLTILQKKKEKSV